MILDPSTPGIEGMHSAKRVILEVTTVVYQAARWARSLGVGGTAIARVETHDSGASSFCEEMMSQTSLVLGFSTNMGDRTEGESTGSMLGPTRGWSLECSAELHDSRVRKGRRVIKSIPEVA